MGEMASMNEIEEFLNGALVSWLESCLSRPEMLSGYSSLLDGTIIHSVWLQIDPEPQHQPTSLVGLEGAALGNRRAKNFDAIVRNLKSLYEEELGQTILVLPDCFVLGFNPETKAGLEQMKILLTLLLGAAVQCPNKEIFIGRIKELDVNIQHAIVELIKQVTDNHSLVLTQESLDLLTPPTMYDHILRLTKERDNFYSKWIASVTNNIEAERQRDENSDGCQSNPLSPSSGMATSTSSSDSNHMAVELADIKSKLRKLRQELEEKSESYLEVKEELEYKSNQYDKLRMESQEWYTEAKRAAAYRDEVDVLRERAERADRLEMEVQKFREKLTDAEFYKTRVEELREDNRVLMETKEMLEEQLQTSRKRSEHFMSLESEIIKYKQKLNDLALERDADRNKLQELLEENTQLQLVTKSINTAIEQDRSFSDKEEDCNSGDNSLSEQLTNSAQTRALKLELENRRLLAALDQLKESTFHESTNKILELEKEKKKLTLKLEQIQENCNRLNQQNKELEDVFRNALEENKKLQDTLDLRQKASEKQNQEREIDRNKLQDMEKIIESLNKEKQRIQTLNESVQRRAEDLERMLESKMKEVEILTTRTKDFENAKNKIYDLEGKISSLEKENSNLCRDVSKLKENLESKSVELDDLLSKNETQNKDIQKLTKDLEKSSLDSNKLHDLEKENQELLSQKRIDLETIATLQKDLVNGTLATNKVKHNLEKLGLDNTEIEQADLNVVEHVVEKLVKNPETFRTVREIMLNTTKEQNAKSDICVLCHRKEIFTVEKNIEITGDSDRDLFSFENNSNNLIINASLGNAKWKEQYEQLRATNVTLQNANDSLEQEKARLNVDISTLSSQITSLNTQQVALQLANSQLASEKDALLKQLEAIKQEHKNLLHDQTTLQCLHDQLSSEYESLNKDKESLKSLIRDLRNENRDLKEKAIGLDKTIEDLNLKVASMKSSAENLTILRAEHSKLTDDFRRLFATQDHCKNEYKNIQEQYKIIRSENGRLKLQITELTGELNLRTDQLKALEIEYTKVAQKCDMLVQMNSNLDTDRTALMNNVSQLLTQYHELLTHSLEDKQHYHDEEKNYTDKVNSLNRQKEKLEEKIMEHYKKTESCAPKKKAFVGNFVKRVKKGSTDLMNKVTSRHRRSWIEDSRLTQSQFTLGSESGGNESDNSMEEPNSIASDSNLIQRTASIRQSFQRSTSENTENTVLRGGVRSSLQSRKELLSRRNSMHGRLEAPDVTGSSLTLGAAGSRRTVYLIDEIQKLPESQNSPGLNIGNNSPTTPNDGGLSTPTNPVISNTNGNSNSVGGTMKSGDPPPPPPATFLMYNRINTTMLSNPDGISQQISIPDTSLTSMGTNSSYGVDGAHEDTTNNVSEEGTPKHLSKKRSDDKTSSIWYEYGCV